MWATVWVCFGELVWAGWVTQVQLFVIEANGKDTYSPPASGAVIHGASYKQYIHLKRVTK